MTNISAKIASIKEIELLYVKGVRDLVNFSFNSYLRNFNNKQIEAYDLLLSDSNIVLKEAGVAYFELYYDDNSKQFQYRKKEIKTLINTFLK